MNNTLYFRKNYVWMLYIDTDFLLSFLIMFVSFFVHHIYRAPIGQGYGLTETCAGATFSEYDDTSVGRVGPPIPCSVIKVKYYPP